MQHYKKSPAPTTSFPLAAKVVAICIGLAVVYYWGFSGSSVAPVKVAEHTASSNTATVELSETQLKSIKTESATEREFKIEREAFGSVAYHEKDGLSNPHVEKNTKVVVANVSESDSPLIRAGQNVEVKVAAYPDHVFTGKVSTVGVTVYDAGGNPAIDPNTHRITVQCEITDPKNELYPGMLASVEIQIGKPLTSVAIPQDGVVREGDGTMSVWVATDHQHFTRRQVNIGLRQDGYDQILEGVQPGEQVVTEGAVFISNILYALPSE